MSDTRGYIKDNDIEALFEELLQRIKSKEPESPVKFLISVLQDEGESLLEKVRGGGAPTVTFENKGDLACAGQAMDIRKSFERILPKCFVSQPTLISEKKPDDDFESKKPDVDVDSNEDDVKIEHIKVKTVHSVPDEGDSESSKSSKSDESDDVKSEGTQVGSHTRTITDEVVEKADCSEDGTVEKNSDVEDKDIEKESLEVKEEEKSLEKECVPEDNIVEVELIMEDEADEEERTIENDHEVAEEDCNVEDEVAEKELDCYSLVTESCNLTQYASWTDGVIDIEKYLDIESLYCEDMRRGMALEGSTAQVYQVRNVHSAPPPSPSPQTLFNKEEQNEELLLSEEVFSSPVKAVLEADVPNLNQTLFFDDADEDIPVITQNPYQQMMAVSQAPDKKVTELKGEAKSLQRSSLSYINSIRDDLSVSELSGCRWTFAESVS